MSIETESNRAIYLWLKDGEARNRRAAAWLGSMDLASGQSRGLLHFLPSKLSPRGVVRAFTFECQGLAMGSSSALGV